MYEAPADSLLFLFVSCPQELAQSRRDATQLTTEVEQLRKEKADLVGELETHKVMVRPTM